MADPDTDAFAEMEAFAAEEEAAPAPVEAEEPPAIEADDQPEGEGPEDDDQSNDDEAAARALGWRPESEWRGPKDGWQDAATFLERARHSYKTISKMEQQFAEERQRNEERFRKFGELAEIQRKRAVAEAEARMKQAREDLDFDAYEAAQKDRAQLETPKPEAPPAEVERAKEMVAKVEAFRGANEWAKNDFIWGKVAAEVGPMIDSSPRPLSFEQQMKMAEDAARAMFPDAFGKAPPKPTTAAVDNGGLRQPGRKTETGWEQLPSEDRTFLEGMIRSGDFKDRADAMKHYRSTFGG